ncbi:flagellar protein export ATPase FliI [Pseudoroseomonas wenyumeiae]|uniref:Flagellar protein export ATPase FliI n=2 Tax=Teichococcus wenyumeiae TaxID=2478470 RepID=A0ABX9VHP1_9PROT|nr:FliI/YscN family ATPase [Pseudoroseomonas wenyumeiae]RMI20247.1 flagellar protein export ATPase FliI [Pseudoroseomonas wenyumeiae]
MDYFSNIGAPRPSTRPAASLADAPALLRQLPPHHRWGRLAAVRGAALSVEGLGGGLSIGDRMMVRRPGQPAVEGEFVAFEGGTAIAVPEGSTEGLAPGARVWLEEPLSLAPCDAWLGRVIDGQGRPLDGRGPLPAGRRAVPLRRPAPDALRRRMVGPRLETGLRALDVFTPVCRGQRMGIFAASGVGKSTLMGMLARFVEADVIVVGLVGERGREVREFLDHTLGEEGRARSVVVVSTSDQPALARRRAAQATLAVAEHFRAEGKQVFLLLDSVTRLAHAQREIGLAAGEPATARSYTPSVFNELPALLERAGPGPEGEGDITAIFTVLVDGDDHDEPIADAVRGILDGHIVLDRRIGERGRWPAIDILRSVSRALPRCHSAEENALLGEARRLLGAYADMAEMIRLGAYRTGSDPLVDLAIRQQPELEAFLSQAVDERAAAPEAFAQLAAALKG